MNHATRALLLVLLGLAIAVPANAAIIYAVDGDSDLAFILDTDAETVSSFDTSAVGIGYAIAVGDTILLGDRDDNGAVEYNLDGTPTGNTYAGGGNFSELLDGTTDGVTNNYGVECCGSTNSVTIADLNWEGQAVLFDLPGGFDGTGISYDSSNGTLWVSQFPTNEIYNFALDGSEISSFTSAAPSACCLAYDPNDDTLWVGSNGSNVLRQYAKDGTLLDTVTIGGWSPSNQWGAEIGGIVQQGGATAGFRVTKTFSDGRDDDVDVRLTCNSGLPLQQDFTISGGGDGVLFVVTELQGSETVCEVTESGGPAGYTPVFNGGAGCTFEGVTGGLYTCEITNEADPATFTVTKEWVVEGAVREEVQEEASVTIYCNNEIAGGFFNGSEYQYNDFLSGDGDFVEVSVDTSTQSAQCRAEENIFQSGVESEDDCGTRTIPAGGSSSCTITNTVFFEGIPTLSQWGMAIMALLMLGVGLVGFRRFT